MLKNCSKWNSRVMGGRTRSQIAIYDQQTGIVHRPTEHLFRQPSERYRAQNPMQLYVYPPPRWVRPKNVPSASVEVNYFLRVNPALKDAINVKADPGLAAQNTPVEAAIPMEQLQQSSSTPARAAATSGQKIYDNELDLCDYDLDDMEPNEQSDEEDWGASRKKRKKTGAAAATSSGRPSRKAAIAVGGPTSQANVTPIVVKIPKSDPDSANAGTPCSSVSTPGGGGTTSGGGTVSEPRPFICQLCGAKYKSRPGLTYHKIHVHQSDSNAETPKSPIISSKVQVSEYCDFCLGDHNKNAEGKAEQLTTCHDCGRSGHPSCLKFTKNMHISTKRYGWQCIECKSCAICGTSENDDQLLFCDDCDRGFHLYCLKPPLKAPPETDWSCHLCVQAFGIEASVNKAANKNEQRAATSNIK